MLKKNPQQGFTLIELMAVIAVIAIMAAIVYPSYMESAKKTRRAEAKTALLENAQRLERCFTSTNTYIGCAAVALGATENGSYDIQFDGAATASTYTLEATAQGNQATDTKCAWFSINEKGIKAAESDDCW